MTMKRTRYFLAQSTLPATQAPLSLPAPPASSAATSPVTAEPASTHLHADTNALPQAYYGAPTPPRSFLFLGTGWAYGIGCGAGPFIGLGVGLNPGVIFGAGAGVGLFCGVGFGAGVVAGSGQGYIPRGFNTSFFYTPRIGWAERAVEEYRARRARGELGDMAGFGGAVRAVREAIGRRWRTVKAGAAKGGAG